MPNKILRRLNEITKTRKGETMSNELRAEDFLNVDLIESRSFRYGAEWGSDKKTAEAFYAKKYEEGKQQGANSCVVTIAVNDVWGATEWRGASVSSCEKIGYHAGSAAFLRGVLESGCVVVVVRSNAEGLEYFRLNYPARLAEKISREEYEAARNAYKARKIREEAAKIFAE